jgi:hypothetical protein
MPPSFRPGPLPYLRCVFFSFGQRFYVSPRVEASCGKHPRPLAVCRMQNIQLDMLSSAVRRIPSQGRVEPFVV